MAQSSAGYFSMLVIDQVAYMDISLSVGTRAWFANQGGVGFGASFTGNTAGIETVNVAAVMVGHQPVLRR